MSCFQRVSQSYPSARQLRRRKPPGAMHIAMAPMYKYTYRALGWVALPRARFPDTEMESEYRGTHIEFVVESEGPTTTTDSVEKAVRPQSANARGVLGAIPCGAPPSAASSSERRVCARVPDPGGRDSRSTHRGRRAHRTPHDPWCVAARWCGLRLANHVVEGPLGLFRRIRGGGHARTV